MEYKFKRSISVCCGQVDDLGGGIACGMKQKRGDAFCSPVPKRKPTIRVKSS